MKVAEGEARITGRGVLVIVVDGLRWDHTSLAGYDRDTTPFLRRFARQCAVFKDTWSPTTSQLGAHVAILTGCDPALAQPPRAFGEDRTSATPEDTPWFLPGGLELLGQPFLGAGWTTAAFVDDPEIAGLRGFDRGFREFFEYGGAGEEADGVVGVFGVGQRFVQWLYDLPLDQDWFAYVHMEDLERVWADREEVSAYRAVGVEDDWTPRPELARVPPLGVGERRLHLLPPSRAAEGEPLSLGEYELRYDRGIRGIDASLERLVGHADEYGRAELLTIVIVGSHGTSLGEGGLYLQAGRVAAPDLQVPLLVRPSRALREQVGWAEEQTPWRVTGVASLIDVAPTLVDLYGLVCPEPMHGVSLAPALRDRSRVARDRVFLRSSILPARGFVESGRLFVQPDGHQGHAEPRPVSPSPPGDAPDGATLVEAWETLLLSQRRALHFGGEVPVHGGDAPDPVGSREAARLQGAREARD